MKNSSTAKIFVKSNFCNFSRLLWTKFIRFCAKNYSIVSVFRFFGDICVPSTVENNSTCRGRCQGIRDGNFVFGGIAYCYLELFTLSYWVARDVVSIDLAPLSSSISLKATT